VTEYKTFNDFFSRSLKPGTRPIASLDDPTVVVSPADCRLICFPTVEETKRLWLKGGGFSVAELLGVGLGEEEEELGILADSFKDASVAIARLAPADYHRWHTPVTGRFVRMYRLAGTYYSVSPRAVMSMFSLQINERFMSLILDLRFLGR